MKETVVRFGKIMLIVVTLGTMAAALSSVPSRPVAASTTADETVKVVNTPLPVQGTVAATQSGFWNVGITGTPTVAVSNFPSTQNVAITGTPTVNANITFPSSIGVTNPATAPLFSASVDEPGRIPYQSALANFSCATGSDCNINFGAVPTGFRLVVRHISINLFTSSPSQGAFVAASVLQSGLAVQSVSFTFPMLPPGGVGNVLGDQAVLMYLDAGENLKIDLGPFNGSYTAAVSGYLLNCSLAPCASIASF